MRNLISIVFILFSLNAQWYKDYKDGVNYLEEKNYLSAIEKLQSAINSKYEDSKRVRAYGVKFIEYFPHRELGISYYYLSRFEDAKREIQISMRQAYSVRAKQFMDLIKSKNKKSDQIVARKITKSNTGASKSQNTFNINNYNEYLSSLTSVLEFEEQFNNNLNSWKLGSGFSMSYGNYRLVKKDKKSTVSSYKMVKIDYDIDFTIDTYFKVKSADSKNTINLVWGNSFPDQYTFGITTDKKFRISKYENKKWKTFANYIVHKSMKPYKGVKLTVRKLKDYYVFFIDDQYVKHIPFEKPKGNYLGFSAYYNADVNIDYIKVHQHHPFKRGLPPDIHAELSFADGNDNGILEAMEEAKVHLKLTNKGGGPANLLEISLESDKKDQGLVVSPVKRIPVLNVNESREVTIKIKANQKIKNGDHKFTINVFEFFGNDMDPAQLFLSTKAFDPPKFVYAGHEVIDSGENTFARTQDDQLEAGEQVKLRVYIQNIGQAKAKKVKYLLLSKDQNISLVDPSKSFYGLKIKGSTGDFSIGEHRYLEFYLQPNKRVKTKGNLPIYLTITEETESGNLKSFNVPLKLNQRSPQKNILAVEGKGGFKAKAKVAKFTFSSTKFKMRQNNLININNVVAGKTKRPKSIGIVIGIEKYDNLPEAPYADNDAEVMKKYFERRFGVEEVIIAKNNDISGFFFDQIFDPNSGEISRAVIPNETEIFVFYSGHGVPNKDGSETYLFPSDGKMEFLDKQGYRLSKFYSSLKKLNAKHVTVILDACFSGASRTSDKFSMQNLIAAKGVKLKISKPWLNYKNFTIINSSSGEETSLGFDETETGLFTYYLALGLKGSADSDADKKITLGELKSYVSAKVKDMAHKMRGGSQSPEFHGDDNRVLVEY